MTIEISAKLDGTSITVRPADKDRTDFHVAVETVSDIFCFLTSLGVDDQGGAMINRREIETRLDDIAFSGDKEWCIDTTIDLIKAVMSNSGKSLTRPTCREEVLLAALKYAASGVDKGPVYDADHKDATQEWIDEWMGGAYSCQRELEVHMGWEPNSSLEYIVGLAPPKGT